MTGRDLFLEIGNISEEYIAEAEAYQSSRTSGIYVLKTPAIRRTLTTAACLMICAGLVFTIQKMGITKDMASESAMEGNMLMEIRPESVKTEEAAGQQIEASLAPETVEEMKDALTMEEKKEAPMKEVAEEKETVNIAHSTVGTGDKESDIKYENLQWDIDAVKKKMAAYPDTYEDIIKLEGVLILVHGSVEKGQDIWEAFLKTVEGGEASQAEIIRFTVEGDPIIETVYYDGNAFYLCVDNSRDAFRGSGNACFEAQFNRLVKEEVEQRNGTKTIEYYLTDGVNKYSIAYISE